MPDARGALDGVRVIDVTHGVGGPMLAMLLAEQGADVVKVEPPGGDPFRSEPAFHVLNRSKRGVTLDLQSDAGRRALRSLLATADVFLQDWAPGLDAATGFGANELHGVNPRLVIGYLPAYGSRGPWAHLPVEEALVQAVAGLSDAQYRYDPRPVYINIPIGGYAQAVIGAVMVAATLYARDHRGRGDRFELSAVAATFAMETIAWLRAEGVLRLAGQQDPKGPIPTYRLVHAKDDWFFAGALTPPFWASMAVAAGLEAELIEPRFAGAPMGIASLDDRRELARRVDAAFATDTRDAWLQILEDADVPRAPVLAREEWARDPQVVHNRMIVDVHDPELGPTKQMGVPVTLRHSPGRVSGPAPRLGEHNALLHERHAQAAPPHAPDDAAPRRHPLEGIVVLDLGGFIAGASCSMMLADLGADVVKIESPGGDGWRSSGLAFLGSNRSKRSLCIDLKRPEGRDLFLEMAAGADAVLDNLRAGVMERLGIGWDALSARNPRIVHCSVTGYGSDGPYAHLPGFDPMLQARGGVMRMQGDPGGEPVYLQLPVCDYGTALTATYGIICALVARERSGRGDRVETSLANSAMTMQAGEFLFYDGRPPHPAGGRDLAGRNALYRVYGASDGWLMLACTKIAHAAAFSARSAIALPDDAFSCPAEGALADRIAATFATRPRDEWIAMLLPDVPVAPCTTVGDLFDDPHTIANNLWWDCEHPQWGHVRQTGAIASWGDMSMSLSRRAPLIGEHSRELLRERGIDDVRVDALIDAGVVKQWVPR
jgi:crotonobetainyl-CoA:carnitine CoA-transferase CaiB-like acyl-CoA transferase